jgi:hypothetical protein
VEIGIDTAFVVNAMFDELDLLDPIAPAPVRPHLTVIRSRADDVA